MTGASEAGVQAGEPRAPKRLGWLPVTLIAVAAFLVGNLTGFVVGLQATKVGKDLLEDLASNEEPAAVIQPQTLTRPGFTLRYPSNWRIDTADEDYDPDHLFSLESPGSSFCMFVVFDFTSVPAENVQAQVQQFQKILSVTKRTSFTQWGNLQGQGVVLQGRLMGLKGGVRIFSHATASRSFCVVEQYFDDDLVHVQPGFKLVEQSFRLLTPPVAESQ